MPKGSGTACTSGTTPSTTGRSGGRWHLRIFPDPGRGNRDPGTGVSFGRHFLDPGSRIPTRLSMKKIGVLFGMENTFPAALVERINAIAVPGVVAEFVQIGDVRMAEGCGYEVVVDRISHDIPFYRAWLKNAALRGTKVINNPYWWSDDDKFINYA